MVSAQLVASILTFIPAMALLFWILHRYEGYFEQNRLFFALTLGIFTGLGVRFLELALFQFESAAVAQLTGIPFSFLYTVVGYGLLEAMANQAILGFRKFRARQDTPYYGAALGVGFGAMWSLQMSTVLIRDNVEPALQLTFPTLAKLIEAALFGSGMVLAHAAAAVWVGKGSGDGKLWRGAAIGALWLMPALAVYWFIIRGSPGLLPVLALLAYGLFALQQAHKRVLEAIVPPEIRDLVRKERRRAARKGE